MQKDNFVLIIGNIVTRRIEKDGMNRRIVAIDDILADFNKIYVENIKNVSTIRYWGPMFFKLPAQTVQIAIPILQ